MKKYQLSKTGVRIYEDWRDNIIIDSHAVDIGKSRLASENSEDALTWNIFCTLKYVHPTSLWFNEVFSPIKIPNSETTLFHFWKPYSHSPSYSIPEGPTYVDFGIETDTCLIFVEAKFGSRISSGTKHNPDRNQIIRNIDVGSWHANQSNKDFYFFLLTPKKHETDLVAKYRIVDNLKNDLSHREDSIDFESLASHIYRIHWETIVDLLRDTIFQQKAGDTFDDLLTWLDGKF